MDNATITPSIPPEFMHLMPVGPPPELSMLIVVAGTSPSFIRNFLAVRYPNVLMFNNKSFWRTLAVDFCAIVLPVELMITLLNRYSPYLLLFTVITSVLLVVCSLFGNQNISTNQTTSFLKLPMKNTPFASYFRAYTNIFTGFSILAVDFIIYPPYFYKSRAYGTQLMDAGLGFYIISNAIVSPEARGIVSKLSKKATFLKAVKDSLPLIVLGILRYNLLKLANYHTPLQEYGLHWNFFWTLATVKFASTILSCLTPVAMRPFLAPILITCHQIALHNGLRLFVLFGFTGNASRDGFIEANREGIVSSIGFLAIYFVGVQLGILLMKKRETIGEWLKALLQLFLLCSSSWVLMHVTSHLIEKPIRRMANMPYMFFVIAITTITVVECLIFDIIICYYTHRRKQTLTKSEAHVLETSDLTCTLLQAINHNGLLFFILANLMTGVVNLSCYTMTFSRPAAFVIVTVYMVILSVISLYLYQRKLSFKALIMGRRRKVSSHGQTANDPSTKLVETA